MAVGYPGGDHSLVQRDFASPAVNADVTGGDGKATCGKDRACADELYPAALRTGSRDSRVFENNRGAGGLRSIAY